MQNTLTLEIRWVLLSGIINTCDLSGLAVILFAVVHSYTFCKLRYIFPLRIMGLGAWIITHVSSAYKQEVELYASGKSFT